MKQFLKKIEDNCNQIIEIVLLLAVLIGPSFCDLNGMFAQYIGSNSIDPDNVLYILVLRKSNVFIGVVFSVFVWFFPVRKYNHDKVVMNRVNTYHAYPYWWYWFSAKVLNIGKCSLKKVPPYIQMKLVINELFADYPIDDNDYPEDNGEIKVEKKNFKNGNQPKEINVILEDTYPIEHRQLPHSKSMLPTLKVCRERGNDLSRRYSPKFISTVSSELRKLPEDITVNVFATLNPKNMKYIASGAFGLAERGNVKHLYVFQQKSSNGRYFKDKGKKIF